MSRWGRKTKRATERRSPPPDDETVALFDATALVETEDSIVMRSAKKLRGRKSRGVVVIVRPDVSTDAIAAELRRLADELEHVSPTS